MTQSDGNDERAGIDIGGGGLVREETCLQIFSTPNSGAIFPITFNDCGAIFPIFFCGRQVQILYPVLGSYDQGQRLGAINNLDAICSAETYVDLSKLDPDHTFYSSGVPLSKESRP